MPLTLNETLKAIKALNTEQDIIKQACEKLTRATEGALNEKNMAIELVFLAKKLKNPPEIISAILQALVTLMALSVKDNSDKIFLDLIKEDLELRYIKALGTTHLLRSVGLISDDM